MLSVQFYKQKVPTRSALPRLWRWKRPLPPIPPYPHTPIHLITNHLRFAPVSCRRFPRAHQSPGEGIRPRRLGSLSCRRLPARRLEQRTSHGRYCLRLDQPSPDHKPGLLATVPRDVCQDNSGRLTVGRGESVPRTPYRRWPVDHPHATASLAAVGRGALRAASRAAACAICSRHSGVAHSHASMRPSTTTAPLPFGPLQIEHISTGSGVAISSGASDVLASNRLMSHFRPAAELCHLPLFFSASSANSE